MYRSSATKSISRVQFYTCQVQWFDLCKLYIIWTVSVNCS